MITSDLQRDVRKLELRTRRRVDDLYAGEYVTSFKGRGVEFSEVREYQPGDDVRAIDWNVTARTGRPYIKLFVETRQLTLVLAVDISASASFGTVTKSKRRLATEVAAVLAMAGARHSDRVGLLLFSDRREAFLPPRKGRSHAQRLLHALVATEPEGTGTDVGEALSLITRMQRRRGLVCVISDFRSPDFEHDLRTLTRRHEVLCIAIDDPREYDLPSVGLLDVVDPESGDRAVLDTSSTRVREAYREAARRQRIEALATIRRTGAASIELSTNRPFMVDLVSHFRRIRR